MDINLSRTFPAIVETGSFSEAATRVHVTQSTVSSRIKTLEELVGQVLFTRTQLRRLSAENRVRHDIRL